MRFLCKAALASVSYRRPWADKTQLPAPPLPVIQDPSTWPLRGESEGASRRWRGGRKGGTTLGTPFPSDPSPYYRPDCESETKQQQRLISCGFALCAYYVYWKDHYTDWTTCTRCSPPLTLQLVGIDLSLLFKHSAGYIRMNHGPHNTSKYAFKQHDYSRSTFLIGCNSLTQ